MEKTVDLVFTDDIKLEFLKRFSLEPEFKKLGDFENYVYEVYKEGTPFILRVTHSSHRDKADLLSELDWMNYLNDKGVNVPKCYLSPNNEFVETLQASDGTYFFGSLFSKAQGEPVKVNDDEKFNPKLFYAWGKTIGKMHHETIQYTLPENVKKRPQWDDDDLLNVEDYISSEEQSIIKNAQELLVELKSLPKTKENYGLIHTDIHSGNFFFDGHEIHVFDFDDCSYQWFTSDIAIPVYYSVLYRYPNGNQEERNRFGNMYLESFIEGYETEHKLPDGWKEQLPLFMRLRDVVLYAVFHKKIAPEDRNERILALMSEIKMRVENKEAIIDVNV
ncbi:phosphotransferase [Bacillus sp. 31A1R]|uniref:Phosphotransferase n=1 Tax=Robertmurraya mangrovi TaxID=3098077 RepID=A0ABU5ITW1_9BACI|nr:phosphotransferase [Bacillus sp. 31A1R]MDZ5470551.1 phosphotransferase [Bacillus sp. 31A1R]